MYFDQDFRHRAERWALDTLNPDGLFICGGDGAKTMEARYSVYQRCDDQLVPREFAFALDNVRPFTVNRDSVSTTTNGKRSYWRDSWGSFVPTTAFGGSLTPR
jgi:hypothetical protein